MKRLKAYLKGFLIVNIIWFLAYIICRKAEIPNLLEVYGSFRFFFKEDLYIDVLMSLYRITVGISIALILGSIIGYFMAVTKKINNVLNPLVVFLNPVPKAALFPVFFVVFGPGEGSKILILTLIVLFHVIISVRDTVLEIDSASVDYLISLGASKKQLFKNIVIPEIIPGLIISVRKKMRTAISILFFSEVLGTAKGVGYYVLSAWQRKDYISMYKGIIIICIIAIILYQLAEFVESRLTKNINESRRTAHGILTAIN